MLLFLKGSIKYNFFSNDYEFVGVLETVPNKNLHYFLFISIIYLSQMEPTKAVVSRYSVEKLFLEISQNSQENTTASF